MNIGIVGIGKMAGAIIRGLPFFQKPEENTNYQLYLYDVRPAATEELCCHSFVHSAQSLNDLSCCDVILLAIKPQTFSTHFDSFKCLPASALFISIMAGTSIESIQQLHQTPMRIIRIMPNLPIQYHEGMSVFVPNSLITPQDIDFLNLLISSSSDLLPIDNEALIDAMTIIIGSGPAYVFQLASDLYKFTVQQGIPEEHAQKIVVQLLFGSAVCLQNSDLSFSELIQSVMSPGGTTEAVFDYFKTARLSDIMNEAFTAGLQRAIDLKSYQG